MTNKSTKDKIFQSWNEDKSGFETLFYGEKVFIKSDTIEQNLNVAAQENQMKQIYLGLVYSVFDKDDTPIFSLNDFDQFKKMKNTPEFLKLLKTIADYKNESANRIDGETVEKAEGN